MQDPSFAYSNTAFNFSLEDPRARGLALHFLLSTRCLLPISITAEQSLALTGRHVCIEGLLMHTKQYSLYSSSSKEETSLSNTQYLSKIQKCIQLYSKAAAVSIFLSPIHMHCDRYFRNALMGFSDSISRFSFAATEYIINTTLMPVFSRLLSNDQKVKLT